VAVRRRSGRRRARRAAGMVRRRMVDTPVYERSRLPAAARLPGPVVIDESGSTTIVPPAWSARVLDHGDLLLERNDA